jgi:hypothetical protein
MAGMTDDELDSYKDVIKEAVPRMMRIVEDGGIGVNSIETDREQWTYSVGRDRAGKPELLISGVDGRVAASAIQMLNFLEDDGMITIAPGIIELPHSDDHEDFRYLAIKVDKPKSAVPLAIAIADDASTLTCLQIIVFDSEGRWPWQPDYDENPQPYFGELPDGFRNLPQGVGA